MSNHKANLEYIERKATTFSNQRSLPQEDLYSYLIDKYLVIVDNFQEDKNIPFENYMKSCINGYCLNYIRDVYLKDIPSSLKRNWVEYNTLKKLNYDEEYIENYLGISIDILNQQNKLLNNTWGNNSVFVENMSKKQERNISEETILRLNDYLKDGLDEKSICIKESFNFELIDYCN